MSDLKLPELNKVKHWKGTVEGYRTADVDAFKEAALRESAADKQRIAELEKIIEEMSESAEKVEQQRDAALDEYELRAERAESQLAIARDLIEQLKQEERWIPVEERFPKRRGKFLTCGGVNNMHVSTFDPGLYGEIGFAQNVTHWRPLPAPPEGDLIEGQK